MFNAENLSAFPQVERRLLPDGQSLPGYPVLYTGIMNTWNGYGKWTLQFLEEQYGHCHISADRLDHGKRKYIYLSIREYVQYIRQTQDLNPYYGISVMHLWNEMKNDYQVPEPFNCWYKQYYAETGSRQKVHLSALYIGPKNARSTWHTDIWGTSFWNALFTGKKIWLFITDRRQESLLNDGKVDPFFPDLQKYPLYSRVKPVVCIQQPGELIYCPPDTWHATMALEPSIALTDNFINKDNYRNVLQHFEKSGYRNAYEKMKQIAHTRLHCP